jgi:hypothetical protein
MMLLVLLAITAPTIPTTTTVSAHALGRGIQGYFVGDKMEIEAHVQATALVWGSRPTGTVRFDITDPNFNQTTLFARLNLAGNADVFFTPSTATTYTVIATYLGDNKFVTSVSDTVTPFTFTVGPAVTRTLLTPTRRFVLQNGTVSFTAHVSTGWGFSWTGKSIPVANMSVTFNFSDPNIAPITTTTDGAGNAFTGPVAFPDLGTWSVTATATDLVNVPINYQPSNSNAATVYVVTKLPLCWW